MKTLDRKLFRDLRSMRGQIIAIVLIITCGVASLVTSLTAYRALKSTRDTYYRRYRLADVWVTAKRAPRSVVRDIERIPGVRRARARIVFDVTLDLPSMPQPVSGRTISVPDRREPILNDLHLTRGHWFEGDGAREVIVADQFAKAHGLAIGDRLRVIMNEKKEALRIVGTALSPEYVYLVGGANALLPDPKRFTVLWLSESFAEAVFDSKNAANNFIVTLNRGARAADVIARIDARLEEYGAIGAIGRRDHPPVRFLDDDIKGLAGSAQMAPAIFLGVAAFVLHILMRRLVQTQRTQIALLRAFGYRAREIGVHYLKIALAVGILGAIGGALLGTWFARGMMGLYKEFYKFPVLDFRVDPFAIVVGFVVSVAFAVVGTYGAVRSIGKIAPAEGLRPEAPRVYARTLLEGFPALWRRLGFATRMIVRNLARTKLRAAVTVGGVAMAASILLTSFFMMDATDEIIDRQFRLMERQDVTVAFQDERGKEALYEIRRLAGVRAAEPDLAVAVRLRHGWRTRRTAIQGLAAGQSLRGLLDEDLRSVALPREGLLLSSKIAEILGVRAGDLLDVEVLTGRRQKFRVPVENVVHENMGTNVYADIGRLSRWVDEELVLTGVRIQVSREDDDALGRALKALPAVAGVAFKRQMIESFEDTIAETQSIFNTVLVLFAGIITFGVVYNTARISLAERARELGSMRVLGYTSREVEAVLAGENLFLALVALVPGLALGAWFCWLIVRVYDTELFRFPFVLRMTSILWTMAVVMLFTWFANLLVRRQVRKLDLVEVLKARE